LAKTDGKFPDKTFIDPHFRPYPIVKLIDLGVCETAHITVCDSRISTRFGREWAPKFRPFKTPGSSV